MSDTIKEKVNKKLAEKGHLGSGDLANFAAGNDGNSEVKMHESVDGPVTADVPDAAIQDPVIQVATPNDEVSAARENLKRAGKDAGIDIDYDKVKITQSEKDAFIDSLIDNTRFELPFSIFGGKVTGRIRSRTSEETRALIYEAQRRSNTGEVISDADYSQIFRVATLRLQVSELNSAQYPEAAAPLLAQYNYQAKEGEDVITPPAWYNEAVETWGKKQDGVISAIYSEVLKFEFKYWTLVENSANQDFWRPEDSTSA